MSLDEKRKEFRRMHTKEVKRELSEEDLIKARAIFGGEMPESARFRYVCTFCGSEVSDTCCSEFVELREKSLKSDIEEKKKEDFISKLQIQHGFTPRQIESTFGSFQITDDNRESARKVSDYVRKFDPSKMMNLVLVGKSGRGKTHIATAAVRSIVKKHPDIKMKLGVLLEILSDMKRNGFNEEHAIIDQIKNCKLLFLDDLGTENLTAWSRPILYMLMNYRYEHYLSTIVTANCEPEELAKEIGPATFSRLMEGATVIKMTGDDYRLKGGK